MSRSTPIRWRALAYIERLESRRLLCVIGVDDSGINDHYPPHLGESPVVNDPVISMVTVAGKKAVAQAAAAATPAASGALNGKVVYVSMGHGWTWTGSAWA